MSLKAIAASLLFSTLAACASSSSDGAASSSANETAGTEATVTFAAGDWTPTWSGDLAAGGSLKIDYDFDRLPQCRNTNSVDSWVIEASYRFDGGKTHTIALPGSLGTGETDDTVEIPEGAKTIELWFENHAVGGYDNCAAFDSQYGANYTHDIAQ